MRESWKYEKLGKLCKTGAGGTPLKSKKEYYENGNIPWLRSGEVNNRNIVDCEIKISEEGLNNSSAKLFPPRTVLIAMYGATAGQVGILNFECSTNQAVCGILPNELFIPEFLYYRFLAGQEDLIKQAVGGAQPNISQEKIKNTLVPKIPLPEQKQIVSILDKAFAAIDQAKANIERNIENAKELFQSELGKIFISNGTSFKTTKLQDICEVKDGTHDSPKYVDESEGIPFVTQKNILESGLSFENIKFISNADHDDFFRRSNVGFQDILISMIGANRGMAAIVDDNRVFSIKNVGLIKANKNYHPEFLLYFLRSPIAKKYVLENSRGSAQGFIGLGKLREFPIPFIDIAKQKVLIEKLKEIDLKSKKLVEIYSDKINVLDELKKSILQKAFAGELTEKTINIEKIDIAAEPVSQYQTKN